MNRNYVIINTTEMVKEAAKLTGVEIKFLLALIYHVSRKGVNLIISNKELREYLATQGMELTHIRISSLFSILTSKGVLRREARGVFVINENLFLQESNMEE